MRPTVKRVLRANTAQNAAILWDPGAGRRFLLDVLVINCKNSTLGVQTLQVFDQTANDAGMLYEDSLAVGAELRVILHLPGSFLASSTANLLKVTTSGNMLLFVLAFGREVAG